MTSSPPAQQRDARDSAAAETEEPLVNSFAAFSFSVNYILGVGVLGIPWAFAQAGYVLSTITLTATSLLALVCVKWLVEVLARAEGLHASGLKTPLLHATTNSFHAQEDSPACAGDVLPSTSTATVARTDAVNRNRIANTRRFEVSELCGVFIGPRHRVIFEVCVSLYLAGALWSYASVFASSLASHVPISFLNDGDTCEVDKDSSSGCNDLYLFFLMLFTIAAVPLTCMELREQKFFQVALAVFRFVALTVIITTSIAAIYTRPNDLDEHDSDDHSHGSPPYYSDAVAFDISGLPKLLPIAVYAQILHHSVPGLSQPVANKAQLQSIFSYVLLSTWTFYNIVGISVAAYYGTSINQTCSLAWSHYKGNAGKGEDTPGWATFLGYLVVLFPPIDIASAFPLNALTLANGFAARFLSAERQGQRRYIIPFRIAAALLPIFGAVFVSDLGTILDWTGSMGIVIAFIYPALLQHYSIVTMRREFGPQGHWTQYSSAFSMSRHLISTVVAVSTISLILVCIFNAME